MLYRVLESLKIISTGRRIPAGTVDSLKCLSAETIARLFAKNRIAEVVAPPLAVLPGFKERAAEYEKQGIEDVNDMASSLLSEEGVVNKDDFEEARAWSEVGHDSPDATSVSTILNTAIVYELETDDELGS